MVKNTLPKVQEKANTPTQYDPEVLEFLNQHAEQGISKAQEDNLLPLVVILQKQSPQVEEQDSRYIDGAKPSDIWLRNAPKPIVKGNEGIIFQPCAFIINYLEWVPRERGGGFVARHAEMPADAKRMNDRQNPGRIKYLRPNGNEVTQTRNHVGYVLNASDQPLPFFIPMTSSGHTVSRTWMSKMQTKRLPNGKVAPSYHQYYRLCTHLRTNQFGSWYTWDIQDAGTAKTTAELQRGEELFQAVMAGQKELETMEEQESSEQGQPF
jgi:hypothetical protein